MKTKTTFSLLIALLFWINSEGQNNWQIMTVESWTGTGWQNSMQVTNTFDENNYITNTLGKSWYQPTSSWRNNFQTNFTNNTSGFATQAVSQSFNHQSNTWENTSMTTNSYNLSNNLTNYVTSLWFETWEPIVQGINTYDTNGFLDHSLVQQMDAFWAVWVNNTQTFYTNNEDGTVNQSITQIWPEGDWTNNSRSTYTYDASGKILTDLTEVWSESAWVNFNLETYNYDTNNFLVNTVNQTWVGDLMQWQNETQSFITNNGMGEPTQIINQFWHAESASWLNESRITFSYNLGINNFNRTEFTLFPNPADDFVTIRSDDASLPDFKICDGNGRTILSGNLSHVATIDVSSLSAGLYFIQIGTSNATAKLIKQ